MKFSDLRIRISELGLRKSFAQGLHILDSRYHLFAPLHRLRYFLAINGKKVYFGPVHAAMQGAPIRHYYLQETVRLFADSEEGTRILEIGSWAGGSAITWARALDKYCRGLGEVICVDAWTDYLADSGSTYHFETMRKALQSGAIFDLFNHNVRASGYGNKIFSFRGLSNIRMSMFKESLFDIVFIDGCHTYGAVRRDIDLAAPLVKVGGVLCGDDLELQFLDVDQDTCKRNTKSDFVRDSKTGEHYHPGVALAVWDFFKTRVSEYHGFWLMRKTGCGWEQVTTFSQNPSADADAFKRGR